MSALLRRLGAYVLEPAEPADPPPAPSSAPPRAPSSRSRWSAPSPAAGASPVVAATRAVVLGAPAHVPSVAAACAGELRARAGAATALVCLWRPGPSPDPEDDGGATGPAGATTRAARRLAAALEQQELPATACGRLTWLPLPSEPARAVDAVRRALSVTSVPVVLAVAGPRPEALEPVLAVADLGLAVLAADADEALRALSLDHLPGTVRRIVAPLPPGPPRWAALAGLSRLRSLPAMESA